MPTPITLDEHIELTNEITKLQFFHLWHWLKSHPGETFADALRKRVDLGRKLDPNPVHFDIAKADFDSQLWQDISAKLKNLYDSAQSADAFEQSAYDNVADHLRSFGERTFGSTTKFERYQCGSLKYDPPHESEPSVVFLHIGNAVAPKSIFTDPGYLEGCILDLVDQVEEKYGRSTVKTHTWLNSLPKWLEYFPQEWQDNLGPEGKDDPQHHFGYWGQFISARGSFNYKYASKFRENCVFPFYPRASYCSTALLRDHNRQRLRDI